MSEPYGEGDDDPRRRQELYYAASWPVAPPSEMIMDWNVDPWDQFRWL